MEGGFTTDPYGAWGKALKDYAWNWVSFQPFDRHVVQSDGQGDYASISTFIECVKTNQPAAGTKYLIYARWPRIVCNGVESGYDIGQAGSSYPGFNAATYEAWIKAGNGN
jgi:hypothetical protein